MVKPNSKITTKLPFEVVFTPHLVLNTTLKTNVNTRTVKSGVKIAQTTPNRDPRYRALNSLPINLLIRFQYRHTVETKSAREVEWLFIGSSGCPRRPRVPALRCGRFLPDHRGDVKIVASDAWV